MLRQRLWSNGEEPCEEAPQRTASGGPRPDKVMLEGELEHNIAYVPIARSGVRVGKMFSTARRRFMRKLRACELVDTGVSPACPGGCKPASCAAPAGGAAAAANAWAARPARPLFDREPVKLQLMDGAVRIVLADGALGGARLCAEAPRRGDPVKLEAKVLALSRQR
mmetsp:Transcript_8439/g.24157  ORF Transcript_8439/g.24157 Transcript_8439/m.24157 type:complete len:167 (-) Transcript_8439:427-927(-)